MGFLFLVLHPVRLLRLLLPSPPPTTSHHTTCLHTTCPHTTCHRTPSRRLLPPLLITPLVFTLLVHTQLVIAHHFSSHHFSSHHLSSHKLSSHYLSTHNLSSHTTSHHTTCHHTPLLITPLAHTQLDITPLAHLHRHNLLTYNLLTHNLSTHHFSSHHLSSHHLLTYNLLTHNLSLMALGWLWWRALCDIHLHFVWQAWHLMTWIVTLPGRRGTYGTGLALVARLVPRRRSDAAAFCVAGVALCDIHLHFVWQAWHLMTWIVTLRGRRGTYGTGLALVARLVPRRRSDAAAFCVADVALCDIHLHFVWQAWHLMTWIVTLRGRRGTYGTGLALVARLVPRWRSDAAAFCVAGVALCDIHLHFVWQAWHLMTWIVTLRGRRGTYGIHTYIHTSIHPSIHTYMHAYIHTCMHTCIHTQLTHTGLYVDVIAKELALSEAT